MTFDRRSFLLLSVSGLVAGCQTTTSTTPTTRGVPPQSIFAASDARLKNNVFRPADAPATEDADRTLTVADMRVVDVEVVFDPSKSRSFYYAGFGATVVQNELDAKVTRILGTASRFGKVKVRTVVTVTGLSIADENRRANNYDSLILASARFYELDSGREIGQRTSLGAQATYRPAFLGGRDQLLSPIQELDLITTHAATVLKQRLFG